MSVPGERLLRVLIVEDSADDAMFVLRELGRAGYEVRHERVDNARAMRDALGKESWDVVLSDHAMPNFSAPAALALLREGGWPDLPFIIVSGHIGEAAAVEAMRAGAQDYVSKDSLARLVPAIERELGDARGRRERRRTREALRETEKKYRSIFENAGEGIFQTTTGGRLLTANPSMARIFGYEGPEEMVEAVHDVAGQLYAEPGKRVELTRKLRREGRASEFETRARRKDGAEIRVSINARAISEGDEIAGYEGTVEDITERKQAEEDLKESEERTRTVLANAPVVLFALDREGVFTLSEGRGLEAMGLRSGQGVGRSIFDVYRDEPESIAHIRRALGGEEFTSVDALTSLGLVFEVRWSPLRDPDGAVAGVIGVATDITERKRAEEELGRSLDRLVALHEAGRLLSSTLEPEEVGTRLLETMRRTLGLTAVVISLRDPDGRPRVWRSNGLDGLRPKARYAPEARAAREAALGDGAPSRLFWLEAQGEEPVAGLCLPLRAREKVVGLLEAYGPEVLAEGAGAMLESLASQAASAFENARLYETLAEREKRLRELVGKILVAQEEERRRVAYEVHDGLAQVAAAAHQHLQAFAQYHPPATREGREDLERAAGLVRRTVSEARQIIADLRPTALDDLGLEAAVRLHLDSLRADGWRIGYESDLGGERLPVSVETALFRVAQEALNNVGKHANTKRADLFFERRLADPHEVVRLRVRDYGVGFAPEAPGKASGPGERVGLSGMRERVALLGGSFHVASRPGEGTLVVAEVPLRPFAEDDVAG